MPMMTTKDYTDANYVIFVSATSRTGAVAGSLAMRIRSHGEAAMQAIGAGAVNQMVKAVAVAGGYLAEDGLELWSKTAFVEVECDGEKRTGVRLTVVADPIRQPVAGFVPPGRAKGWCDFDE